MTHGTTIKHLVCRDKCRFYFCLYIDVAYYAQFIGNTRELLYEITLTILSEIVDFSPFFHVIKTAPKKEENNLLHWINHDNRYSCFYFEWTFSNLYINR